MQWAALALPKIDQVINQKHKEMEAIKKDTEKKKLPPKKD